MNLHLFEKNHQMKISFKKKLGVPSQLSINQLLQLCFSQVVPHHHLHDLKEAPILGEVSMIADGRNGCISLFLTNPFERDKLDTVSNSWISNTFFLIIYVAFLLKLLLVSYCKFHQASGPSWSLGNRDIVSRGKWFVSSFRKVHKYRWNDKILAWILDPGYATTKSWSQETAKRSPLEMYPSSVGFLSSAWQHQIDQKEYTPPLPPGRLGNWEPENNPLPEISILENHYFGPGKHSCHVPLSLKRPS